MNEPDRLVLYALEEGVATLTLNRPQQLNALDVAMMQALRLAVERAVGDPGAHVIVIGGAGEHFMAGGDLREFDSRLALAPLARLQAFQAMIEQWINPAVLALRGTHRPVLCAVRGACAGFGLSLMLGCDLAIAADNAYFATAYASIGQSPDGGGSAFLSRIVGPRKAAELYLLGERIDAAQALQLGLVSRVVPAAELETATRTLAARLASGPRHAYGEIKRLLAAAPERDLAAQLQAEAEAFARCGATQDFAEGVRAFLEKRKPVFSGK
jgi:2-(1,2-epoxy-1,2-dihydrophenyl)acetyl-CoA isomerase